MNPLILASAFYHPENSVRARLLKIVDRWVNNMKPMGSEKTIRTILTNETGTPLEPFILNDEDIEMAVRLAMAAFSKKVYAERFRIVSKETIGFEGGLVITRNFNHYYAERYIRGECHRKPKTGFTFLPAYTPCSKKSPLVQIGNTQACLETDEEGFVIRLAWPDMTVNRGIAAKRLQRNSRIPSSDKTFDELGLRVDANDSGFEIRTGGPESQIKMTAHMMKHDVIRLSLDSDLPEASLQAMIVLDMPQKPTTPLKTVFVISEKEWLWLQYVPYCSFEIIGQNSPNIPIHISKSLPSEENMFDIPIRISKKDKLAISNWLPPHYSWIDEIWDEMP